MVGKREHKAVLEAWPIRSRPCLDPCRPQRLSKHAKRCMRGDAPVVSSHKEIYWDPYCTAQFVFASPLVRFSP